jgi:hypothetical protein
VHYLFIKIFGKSVQLFKITNTAVDSWAKCTLLPSAPVAANSLPPEFTIVSQIFCTASSPPLLLQASIAGT